MYKCASNVQNKKLYRYSNIHSVCLNKIDVQIRKTLKELDYRNEKQSIQRLYLDERYMGSKLMSARDIHLRTLVSLYKTIQQRDKNDYLMETESEINTKWETKSLY